VQPGTLLEAMVSGVPVVGTDVGGVSEFVVEGRTGFLCEPSNVVSLAVAVDRALSASAAERAAITSAARERVLVHHDSARRQVDYAGVVRRVLGQGYALAADA
jgi:glycosyltransferase involved in cell wall biosynthesis